MSTICLKNPNISCMRPPRHEMDDSRSDPSMDRHMLRRMILRINP
jgi:hypothetical protein